MSAIQRVREEIARIVGDPGARANALETRAMAHAARGMPIENAVRLADRETTSMDRMAAQRHGSNVRRKDF